MLWGDGRDFSLNFFLSPSLPPPLHLSLPPPSPPPPSPPSSLPSSPSPPSQGQRNVRMESQTTARRSAHVPTTLTPAPATMAMLYSKMAPLAWVINDVDVVGVSKPGRGCGQEEKGVWSGREGVSPVSMLLFVYCLFVCLLLTDIDECSESDPTHNCDLSTTRCMNTIGNFSCECLQGFTNQGSPTSCEGKQTNKHNQQSVNF